MSAVYIPSDVSAGMKGIGERCRTSAPVEKAKGCFKEWRHRGGKISIK